MENGICPQCLRGDGFASGSLSLSAFRGKYIKDPVSGIFYADDALLQYRSYREDQRFTPLICGEYGADYKFAHEELRRWYTEHFFLLFEQKISAESTYNPISNDPDYYTQLKNSFTSFLNTMSRLSMWSRIEEKEADSGSVLLKYILKKVLVDLRSNYSTESDLKAADPTKVDLAGSTFDPGSGLYLMELFFLIRDRDVLSDYINALTDLNSDTRRAILRRLQLMVVPWKHQSEALSRWEVSKSGIVEMATATGKTVVGLMAIERLWQKNKQAHVLILCHRSVILNQWRREIIQKFGLIANENLGYKAPITIGAFKIRFETIQTVMKDPLQFRTDLLIIDEVHHIAGEMFGRVLELPHRYQLGLTAQLDEGERKRAVIRNFGKIVYQYGLLEALKDGIIPEFSWVVHPVFLAVKEESEFQEISSQIHSVFSRIKADKNTIRELTGKADYKITTIHDFIWLTERARYSGMEVPQEWMALKGLLQKRRWIIHRSGPRLEKARDFASEMADNHKVIVFLMDTESCDMLASQLKQRGKNVFVIHSNIKEDPIRVINEFRKAPSGILLGVEMLNEGIDIPNADVGINVAFTKTQLQLVQRMGRILRKDKTKKKPQFFQFIAVPDRSSFVEEIDAPEFIDDLSWVQSTAIKMGLDLDIAPDSRELLQYKSDAENFIRESYKTVTSNEQSFGTFNLRKVLEEFDAPAVRRIPEILALYGNNDISDKQWEDIIRTAYAEVNDRGYFEKARFVNVSRSWYILIIANRKGSKINEFFSQIKIPDDLRYTPLPSRWLDNNGIIVFDDGNSFTGPDEQPMDVPVSPPITQAAVVAPVAVSLEESPGVRKVEVSPMDVKKARSTENIFEKILTAEGPAELQMFDAGRESLTDIKSNHSAVIGPPGTDNIPAMITEGRYTEARSVLQRDPEASDSFESYLLDSLAHLNEDRLDDALLRMETALSKKPDDRFLKCYRTMCEVAGKDPLGAVSISSEFGKGVKLQIPGLANNPLSINEVKKWVYAYESGAVDRAIEFYREKQSEEAIQCALPAERRILEQEIECLEILRNHIYLLKLFVLN